MNLTRRQQSYLILSVSLILSVVIVFKFPAFKRPRAIDVTRVIPEALVNVNNAKYFTNNHVEQASVRIKNTGILDNLLITNSDGNAVTQVFLFAALLAFTVVAISKRGRLIDVSGLFVAGLIALILGHLYTYNWFQNNGGDLVQAGYHFREPYFNITFWNVIVLAWIIRLVRTVWLKEKELELDARQTLIAE